MDLKDFVKEVPNWPKVGVTFRDITPMLQNPEALKLVIDELAKPYLDQALAKIVAIDARGFLLASAVAYKLGCGVALVRKPGKLPRPTIKKDYELEYASNTLEMHQDAISPGEKVLIIDDVLATGGTAKATVELVEQLGGQVLGLGFLIDLTFLNGQDKLKGYKVYSLIKY
ncbi:MAG: adenine phosphoribosyltransferase [Candidatus Buchananbacteria bacterium]